MVSEEASKPRLLLVCHQKGLVQKISRIMAAELPHLTFEVADSGATGLAQIYQNPPTVIVVDSALHDISGHQFCRVLKHDPVIRKLPILLVCNEDMGSFLRFNELSLIADMFLEESKIVVAYAESVQTLLKIFAGLAGEELEQIQLLQQQTIQVNSSTRLVQLLDQSITEVTIMNGFRKLFELVHNKSVMVHLFFSLLSNVLDYDVAAVFFNDKNREPRMLSFHAQKEWDIKEHQLELWTQRAFDELRQKTSEQWLFSSTRFEQLHPELSNPERPLTTARYQALYPFYIEKNLVGALVLYNKHPVNYEIIFPFQLVIQELSALMRIRRYYTEAQMFTISDELTGLYTYQYFLWHLDREVREAKRHQAPLSIACVAVDELLDAGYDNGANLADKALKKVAEATLETFRSVDFVSRSRGRTILVLMPNTSPAAAKKAINRLRKSVSQQGLQQGEEEIGVTVTVGIVSLGEETPSAVELIERAEAALEVARQKGRNVVELVQ